MHYRGYDFLSILPYMAVFYEIRVEMHYRGYDIVRTLSYFAAFYDTRVEMHDRGYDIESTSYVVYRSFLTLVEHRY